MAYRLFNDILHAADFMQNHDTYQILQQAFQAQQERHGSIITYINNLHINPTNLCVYDCKFCDFARRPGEEGAYSLSEQQIFEKIEAAKPQEVHIVGGLWKTWGMQRYIELIQNISVSYPAISIKACTAVEIAYFAHMEQLSIHQVLERLKTAGVDMLPGGGAEVLVDRIHQSLHKDKISPFEWLAIHEAAHETGILTNATLLFGHIETQDEILQHLQQIRNLQDRTGGFVSFVPLLYQRGNTQLVKVSPPPHKVLEIIALCRLFLDNVEHIKAYWPTLGLATAAMALNAGANDIDGTLGEETIMQMASTDAPKQLSETMIKQLIVDAGMIPARRNGNHEITNTQS